MPSAKSSQNGWWWILQTDVQVVVLSFSTWGKSSWQQSQDISQFSLYFQCVRVRWHKFLSLKKLLFVEYPSLGDEGIQRTLLLSYRLRGWFTSSYCFCLALSWKRRESNVGRHWYQWDSHLFGVLLHPGSSEQRKNNGVSSPSHSTRNNDTANLTATAGFIFLNDHS